MTIDTDLFVVMGLIMALVAVPAIIGAKSEDRIPYISLAALIVGSALLGAGIVFSPNGYSLARLPHSFVEILARIVN
jgi:uncharacterized membrane protein